MSDKNKNVETIRTSDAEHLAQLKQTLKAKGVELMANENISEHLAEEDLDVMQRQVEFHVQGILDALLIDTDKDHNTNETAKRVAKMYVREVMSGRFKRQPTVTDFPNVKQYTNVYTVGPITVRSLCSHHLAPITGKCVIAVIPGEKVIGLSKFNRLVDWVMRRPQIQEEATEQVASLLDEKLEARAIAVAVVADHMCCQWRGVEDTSNMTTWAFRGEFHFDSNVRREMLTMIERDL